MKVSAKTIINDFFILISSVNKIRHHIFLKQLECFQ